MSDRRIAERWRALRDGGRRALIPYLTAGFPDRAASRSALRAAQDAGADFIEVGIPFSDPLADGPIIQRSTQVALDGGMSVAGVLEVIDEAQLDVPVIAFGYLNPILSYGLDRFLADAASAGVHGILLTDLPLGEDEQIESTLRQGPLSLIPLIAPTTDGARAASRLRDLDGFVYVISRLGVTGAHTNVDDAESVVRRVRGWTPLPIALGFGIATGEQARRVARYADGIVVGSALVEALERGENELVRLLETLRGAIDDL